MSEQPLKRVVVNVTKDDGFSVRYPSAAALKYVLETQMQLDSGQVAEILRQIATPQEEPEVWTVNLY